MPVRVLSLLLFVIVGVVGVSGCMPAPDAPAAVRQTAPQRVAASASEIKVLDGDTILYKGETVRLMGYDTPEKANAERFKGSQEPWASRASDKLRAVLDAAAKVEVAYSPEPDKYGRKLAHLYADGVTVGVPIVKAGLAFANVDHFGAQGFDEEAKQLREAAANAPKPEFEEPFKWRSKNAVNK